MLGVLDERLQTKVYPIIQEKLGAALSGWHPSDRSAKLMLQPWQRALSPGSFLAFLLKHIVPKLQHCMQSMLINPHQQLLGTFLLAFSVASSYNVCDGRSMAVGDGLEGHAVHRQHDAYFGQILFPPMAANVGHVAQSFPQLHASY